MLRFEIFVVLVFWARNAGGAPTVISKGVCLCANHLQLMFSLHEINHLQAVCANKSCPAGSEHLEEDALNREFAKFVNDPSFPDHGGVLPVSAEPGRLDLGTFPTSSAHVTPTVSEPTTDYVTADGSLTSAKVSDTDVESTSTGLRTGSDVRISTSAHTIPGLSLADSRTSHTRVSHNEERTINTTPSETEDPRPTNHPHWSLINTILDYSSVSGHGEDDDDDDDKHDVENETNISPNAAEKYQTTNTISKSTKDPTNTTPTQTVTDWSLFKSTDEKDPSDTPLAVTEDARVTTPIDTLTERSEVNTNSKYTTVYDAEEHLTPAHTPGTRTSAERVEHWPEGVTQDLQQRSLCPWKYVPNIDPDRYPQTLMEAECLSPDCACGLKRSSGLGCERIYRVVAVLRRVKPENCTKRNGFVFERRQEQLAVACTCSVMPTAR